MAMEPLASALFFPVSGDPIGFNHFMAAEWLLRSAPALRRVVFVLSNGHHPDPTKAGAHAPAERRLEMLQASLAELADPARSWLARRAEQAGEGVIGHHVQPVVPLLPFIGTQESGGLADRIARRAIEGVDLLRRGDAPLFD